MTSASSVRRRIALAAAGLCLVGLVARRAAAQRNNFDTGSRSRIDTTFAFDKNGTVNLTSTQGDIVVTGTSGGQARVHATSDGNNLRFDASSTQLSLSMRGNSDSRFELSVPYGVRVIAHSRSGDVQITATRGEVEVRTQNGDIHVEEVANRLDVNTFSGGLTVRTVTGDVEISTTSGDVSIDDLKGNADVQTVSGEIRLREVTAKSVRAHTTSGDVGFEGTIDSTGRYELSTNSGDVGLHIPRDASAQVTVSTWNGTVDTQFPITLAPGEHNVGVATSKRYTFQLGSGAARITAETFSGDITISSNGRGSTERH